MKFWLPVGCAVILLLLLPYIRFICKRISFAYRVTKACSEYGYTFKAAHPFWLFALNNSGHADFYCSSDTDYRLYAVKLVGAPHRLMTLYFIDGDRYQWQRTMPLAGAGVGENGLLGNIVHEHFTRIKDWNPVDFYHNLENDYSKRIIPIIVANPVPNHVMRSVEVRKDIFYIERPNMFEKPKKTVLQHTEIYDSDVIYDAYLFSPRGFLRELEFPFLQF